MSTYLITGCSRGLGLELVRQLATEAMQAGLILATARSEQPSAALQKVIDDSRGRVLYIKLDVNDTASITAAVKTAETALGSRGLDVLVNNAGIGVVEPDMIHSMTREGLSSVLATNVVSVHETSLAFLPLMRKGKDKKVINITSHAGSFVARENFSWLPATSYKISKAALNFMTVEYAATLEKEGFTVMSVSPGHLKTDLGTQFAELEVEVGARATLQIIKESESKDNGRFRLISIEGHPYYNGADVPW